jgi:hypothetical protein
MFLCTQPTTYIVDSDMLKKFKPQVCQLYTVEPWFTNLIRSWRPFVTQNVRKLKLFYIIQ